MKLIDRAFEVFATLKSPFHAINAALLRCRDERVITEQATYFFDKHWNCDVVGTEYVETSPGCYECHFLLQPRAPIRYTTFHFVAPERTIDYQETVVEDMRQSA